MSNIVTTKAVFEAFRHRQELQNSLWISCESPIMSERWVIRYKRQTAGTLFVLDRANRWSLYLTCEIPNDVINDVFALLKLPLYLIAKHYTKWLLETPWGRYDTFMEGYTIPLEKLMAPPV